MSSTPSRSEQMQSAPNEVVEAEEAYKATYVPGTDLYSLPKPPSSLTSVTIEHEALTDYQEANVPGALTFKLVGARPEATQENIVVESAERTYSDFEFSGAQALWDEGAGTEVTLTWGTEDPPEDQEPIRVRYSVLKALEGASLSENDLDLSGCQETITGTELVVIYNTAVRKLLNQEEDPE